jgi:hypothetical protein
MRWSGINRTGLVLILTFMLSSAAAIAFTSDADLLVTDGRGVIVGVGRLTVGVSFELRLMGGFSGPARLTMLHQDGRTETLDIVVGDGIAHGELDLLELILDRFGVVTIERGGAPWPPSGRDAGRAAAAEATAVEAAAGEAAAGEAAADAAAGGAAAGAPAGGAAAGEARDTPPRVPADPPAVDPPAPRSPGRP